MDEFGQLAVWLKHAKDLPPGPCDALHGHMKLYVFTTLYMLCVPPLSPQACLDLSGLLGQMLC